MQTCFYTRVTSGGVKKRHAREDKRPLVFHSSSSSSSSFLAPCRSLCCCMHACPCSVSSGRSSAAHVRHQLILGTFPSLGGVEGTRSGEEAEPPDCIFRTCVSVSSGQVRVSCDLFNPVLLAPPVWRFSRFVPGLTHVLTAVLTFIALMGQISPHVHARPTAQHM